MRYEILEYISFEMGKARKSYADFESKILSKIKKIEDWHEIHLEMSRLFFLGEQYAGTNVKLSDLSSFEDAVEKYRKDSEEITLQTSDHFGFKYQIEYILKHFPNIKKITFLNPQNKAIAGFLKNL